MKRILLLSLLAIMILALVVGCGKKAEETEQMPVEEQATEMMDTTQMDSAAMEAEEVTEEATGE